MDAPDLAAGLRVIAPDEPCGPDLEFDPDFAEFERLAQGKAEQQYGSTVVPAEEPDWKELVARGRALLERTLDLRVLSQLSVALLQREGLEGLNEGLSLIRAVLEAHWEAVHPRLDPEDDDDPTMRANALLLLREPVRVLRPLRLLPLARSARAGTVSWRDLAVADGVLEPDEGHARLSPTEIAAAFRETDPARLARAARGLSDARRERARHPRRLRRAGGPRQRPRPRRAAQAAARHAPAGGAARPGRPGAGRRGRARRRPPGEDEAAAPGVPAPARGGGMSVASLGAIGSRADALRLMDLVVEYFERHEPGSPLPLLIGRARRLADKDFLDLLRDLAPDGLNQAEVVVGRRPE